MQSPQLRHQVLHKEYIKKNKKKNVRLYSLNSAAKNTPLGQWHCVWVVSGPPSASKASVKEKYSYPSSQNESQRHNSTQPVERR